MSNTNSISGVVKILESPKDKRISNTISVTQCRVQFPQIRQDCLVHLKFWGNLADDVANYYKINDYILIEGYLSINDNLTIYSSRRILKKIEITVLKVYPFLLTDDPISTY
jgi:hypothetical protein